MAAPASRSPAMRRSATTPPPTTRQRRPASSRHTGKWPTSAIDPVRRAPGRLVARDSLDELTGEEPAQVVVGVARGEVPEGLARQTVGQEGAQRSEEHTSELQSLRHLVCRLLLEKKKRKDHTN